MLIEKRLAQSFRSSDFLFESFDRLPRVVVIRTSTHRHGDHRRHLCCSSDLHFASPIRFAGPRIPTDRATSTAVYGFDGTCSPMNAWTTSPNPLFQKSIPVLCSIGFTSARVARAIMTSKRPRGSCSVKGVPGTGANPGITFPHSFRPQRRGRQALRRALPSSDFRPSWYRMVLHLPESLPRRFQIRDRLLQPPWSCCSSCTRCWLFPTDRDLSGRQFPSTVRAKDRWRPDRGPAAESVTRSVDGRRPLHRLHSSTNRNRDCPPRHNRTRHPNWNVLPHSSRNGPARGNEGIRGRLERVHEYGHVRRSQG